MPRKQFMSWSDEDDRSLLALRAMPGLTCWEIANRLGRTEAAISCRLVLLRKAERRDKAPAMAEMRVDHATAAGISA